MRVTECEEALACLLRYADGKVLVAISHDDFQASHPFSAFCMIFLFLM